MVTRGIDDSARAARVIVDVAGIGSEAREDQEERRRDGEREDRDVARAPPPKEEQSHVHRNSERSRFVQNQVIHLGHPLFM